jgi:hypothetical protein
MRDRGGHLSQRRQALALGQPSFQTHVLFNEPAVFNCYSHLVREDLKHSPRFLT